MAGRLLGFSRKFSTQKALRSTLSEPLKETAVVHHDGYKMWKNLFIIVCCPAIVIGYINVKVNEKHVRPEFIKYSHLRIRNKKFCWRDGVKTLFHNPLVNALPDGYEELPEGHH